MGPAAGQTAPSHHFFAVGSGARSKGGQAEDHLAARPRSTADLDASHCFDGESRSALKCELVSLVRLIFHILYNETLRLAFSIALVTCEAAPYTLLL